MKSFIRWVGGKTKNYKFFTKFFPLDLKQRFFIDLFNGSGAFFLNLLPHQALINDINKYLINCFCCVKVKVDELIEELKIHELHDSLEYFEQMKEEFNENINIQFKDSSNIQIAFDPDPRIAGIFIYLNARCYNGLFRTNSEGKFNVSYNQNDINKNVKRICDYPGYYRIAKYLNDNEIIFRNADYRDAFKEFQDRKKTFMILDPPYYPLTKTACFTNYHQTWKNEDFDQLKDFVDSIADKHQFMLCNSECEYIRDLFKDYYIYSIKVNRFVTCKGEDRGILCPEVVITNYKIIDLLSFIQ